MTCKLVLVGEGLNTELIEQHDRSCGVMDLDRGTITACELLLPKGIKFFDGDETEE